ncbi:MAG: UDP-N-acetylglucosamine 2-epimerase [Bacteroidetes bacterium RIFOXYA12_FULL_35_11]|nr:MAG: UDP-N-acetylglucosamine 2-epimerase [Bacteroidetes bacterium GWF2_35_48]OFY82108.1 MAG: UDP-N-acetylglucosamine 2-epimerase [Bacteroidetes bacterium RIFOXYA12_FULL_35_11]OFY93237.1 MAG: UDP-N-acetylglucosamine 2-epimerase [Bacteroidetes bacterium RIFOXYB2_FULL_35_7]OFZ03590.1 MAG: UDP-N-acetylglucosamine 2-epimerase [Bacteroidetes bacterium RIFOXYC12_FULL_35_7]HBX53153.1 UDP-N-acetylglucosamine 2-epimerase (non-hydrolyzing) [Bacteroidales bacterium]
MKLITIIGARPQFIKAATVSRIIAATDGIEEIIVHTGQHYDANMSEIFFEELNIPKPKYNLEVGSGQHGAQTGAMLIKIEEVLLKEKPDAVLIYGDTNSTLAGAFAAVKLHIPIAHVEAGLRSFNRRMPEEINRIAADSISDILFAPTQTAINNLKNEGLEKQTVYSGDVMYDSVLYYKKMILANQEHYKTNIPNSPYFLATIHRAENTDNPENLKKIFAAFGKTDKPILLPIHPRTKKIITDKFELPSNVSIINPVGYLEMLSLVIHSDKVLTDSGGLQKEAFFLDKPCITMREETEWVETLENGWNCIAGADTEKILAGINTPDPVIERGNHFGDGKAAEKIVALIKEKYK